jgi:eukaryotic-like serine/threonine-protein kinase
MKYCPSCHKTYPGDYNVCPADQTPLQNSREFQPGMIIRNKYEILARIGVGGMGAVYRGRHVTFNEPCAIKIVNDSIAGDTNFLQRFQTEAVVTRKLRHPNAVRVDDFDYTEDGRPFIVMELVEGRNVSEVLEAEGPLPVKRALGIATQAARALGAAHKLGFVHRDIKPGNIILTVDEHGQEVAKVLDFGIAKLRQAAGDAQAGMTMTGVLVGTPLYMSPEQFLGKQAGEEIDGRSDLYSLGVVLYQMVTARLPFEGDTLYDIMRKHMEGNVQPPHELTPELGIPAALSAVILKSIDKSRENRFQSADEMIAALDEVTKEFPSGYVAVQKPIVATPDRSPSAPAKPRISTPIPPTQAMTEPPPPSIPNSSRSSSSRPEPRASARPTAVPNTRMIKSAAQHVFLQHRTLRPKNLVMLAVIALAAILLFGGLGFLKYLSVRRMKIERAVIAGFEAAPSATLRTAHISVSVDDAGEVTLDGIVASASDVQTAESLTASVPRVTRVKNRLQVVPSISPPAENRAETSDSLVNKGMASMDAGDYQAAIDYFSKAASDPNNKGAQELVELARRAQKTEEELLKKRK